MKSELIIPSPKSRVLFDPIKVESRFGFKFEDLILYWNRNWDLSRLYVKQYRLIQELCGGTGVVVVKDNVGLTDDAGVMDVVGVTDIVGVTDHMGVRDVVGVKVVEGVTDIVGVKGSASITTVAKCRC